MTQEEKVRAYDKALSVALETYKTQPMYRDWLEKMFPELKESENEMVRKALINGFNKLDKSAVWYNGITNAQILAWLEKQKQKPQGKSALEAIKEEKVDNQNYLKPEPKFKVGDWVVNKGHSYLIADIDFLDNRYLFEIGGYTHEQLNWEYVENVDNKYHLWTIQDAKDGDVLMSRAPFIYGKPIPYGGLDWYNGKFIKASNYVFKDSPVHPATKEQRDLLFSKMKEAGYEWNSEKKELKKIEQKPADARTTGYWHVEDVEQKHDWSEKDERWFKELELMALSFSNDDTYRKKFFDWLKSLKDRVQPQPKQEWSEEDENRINRLIAYFEDKESFTAEDDVVHANWLKSLKNRVQPKQEWSEEDETYLDHIITAIKSYYTDDKGKENPWREELLRWLESLKDRYTWKPSDEQMKALNYVVNLMASSESPRENDYYYNVFKDLRKQLKKLREE